MWSLDISIWELSRSETNNCDAAEQDWESDIFIKIWVVRICEVRFVLISEPITPSKGTTEYDEQN